MSDSSRAEREAMYTEFLRVEGYRPDLDQDGSIRFSRGLEVLHIVLTDDPEYFWLHQDIWVDEAESAGARARRVALEVNDAVSVAKVYIYKGIVLVAAQMYCSPPDAFKPVFERVLRALERAARLFEDKMLESGAPS